MLLVMATCVSPAPPQLASSAPDPDGEFVSVITGTFEILDPQVASWLDEIAVIRMVYEPLLSFEVGTLRPTPAAASDLPTVSPDGLRYRFKLRDGLMYSDGARLRARDFAYGFSRLCDPRTQASYASIAFVIVGCSEWADLPSEATPASHDAARRTLLAKGIRVVSENEIEFVLVHPASYYISVFALWIGAPVRQSEVERVGVQWWSEPNSLVGNGPFVMKEHIQGRRLIFERNGHYRSPAKLKRWTKQVAGPSDLSPAVLFEAYRHNEVDLMPVGPADLAAVQRDARLSPDLVKRSAECSFFVWLNSARPPLDDPDVRLALAKAIDKDAWVKTFEPLGRSSSSLIPPGSPGHDPSDNAQRFDPAEARRLLAASRYSASDALTALTFPYREERAPHRERVTWLAAQWELHLGIVARPVPVPTSEFIQTYRQAKSKRTAFEYAGWCGDYPDQQNWLSTLFETNATGGRGLYSNFEFDRLVSLADREPDRTRRSELYLEASRLLSRDAGGIWLHSSEEAAIAKPWTRGLNFGPFDSGGVLHPEDVYLTREKPR